MADLKSVVFWSVLQVLVCVASGAPSATARVAVVTNADAGYGFYLVQKLCENFTGDVFYTSPNTESGLKDVEILRTIGVYPKYHQLDVSDVKSLEAFRDAIKANYSGIDLLVNNPRENIKEVDSTAALAVKVIDADYFSLVRSSDVLNPILNNGAKVINLWTGYRGKLIIFDDRFRLKLKTTDFGFEELNNLMNKYKEAALKTLLYTPWCEVPPYGVAQFGIYWLTNIHQNALQNRGIIVNSVSLYMMEDSLLDDMRSTKKDDRDYFDDETFTMAIVPLRAALNANQSHFGQFIDYDTLIRYLRNDII